MMTSSGADNDGISSSVNDGLASRLDNDVGGWMNLTPVRGPIGQQDQTRGKRCVPTSRLLSVLPPWNMLADQRRRRNEVDEESRQRQRLNRNERYRAQRSLERNEEIEFLAALSERVLDATELTAEDIQSMATSQAFASDPRLALAYYYCRSTDPAGFVFADEKFRGDEGQPVRERMVRLLDGLPGPSEFAACQHSVSAMTRSPSTFGRVHRVAGFCCRMAMIESVSAGSTSYEALSGWPRKSARSFSGAPLVRWSSNTDKCCSTTRTYTT